MTLRPWILLLIWLATPVSTSRAEDETPPPPPPPDPRSVTERLLDEQRSRRAPEATAGMIGVEAGKVFDRYEKMLAPAPREGQ